MSLITSCPSCGTKFRVVADQLRISDGWVRCGRCQEVFDATHALQEMQAVPTVAVPPIVPPMQAASPAVEAASMEVDSTPVQATPVPEPEPSVTPPEPEFEPAPAVERVQEDAAPVADTQGYELPAPPEAPEDDWLDTPVQEDATIAERLQRVVDHHEPVLDDVAALPELEAALPAEEALAMDWAQSLQIPEFQHSTDAKPADPEEVVTAAPEEPLAVADPVESAAQEALGEDEDEALDEMSADVPLPSFVKEAQRKAWWNKPAVRFAMGMLVIFLPIALALQIAVHERNTLVAWKPQWRPVIEGMCVVLGCEITPRQDIAAVVLTGSSFHEDAQPYYYQLGLSIQNQGDWAVATPAVELTLTDAQDQVLVRKVLTPKEIGAPVELAGRSEWHGTLPVKTQGLNLPVSGYRVMAFYP